MTYPNNSTRNTYLEAEVLNADPIKLVSLLYRGALEAVAAARLHLADGDIPARSAKIMKAWEILAELLTALETRAVTADSGTDAAAGNANGDPASPVSTAPQLVTGLHDLYGYMQQRLLDANAQQADEPLAEVATLLTTLAAAWSELSANPAIAAELATARQAEAQRAAENSNAATLPVTNAPNAATSEYGPAAGSAAEAEPAGYEDLRYLPLRAAL